MKCATESEAKSENYLSILADLLAYQYRAGREITWTDLAAKTQFNSVLVTILNLMALMQTGTARVAVPAIRHNIYTRGGHRFNGSGDLTDLDPLPRAESEAGRGL